MVALNSGETRGDHQDVCGLGEEVVMEDISHVEPALQEIMASLSSTPSHDVSGDTLLPVPEPAEPHLPPLPLLQVLHVLLDQGCTKVLLRFWKSCFLHVIFPFFWMKMRGGSGWNAK